MHRVIYKILGGIALGCWLSSAALAAGITRTDVEIEPGRERALFHADQPMKVVKSFVLSDPPRLVVDLKQLPSGAGVGLSPNYNGTLLRNIRYGKPDAARSRIVLDLSAPKMEHQILLQPDGKQLVVELKGKAAPTPADNGLVLHPVVQPVQVTAPKPTGKPKALIEQAKKPVIVIDAGHGGKDSGAVGHAAREKHVTLDYAKSLRHALLKTGRYQVALTRGDDRYLFLKERVKLARKAHADLFISLHADSNPNPKAQGLSVYTISEKASDAESAALAAQENKADVIGGFDLSVEDEEVASILIDLAQVETRNKASRFAELLVDNMHPKVPLLTNTHRFAGFRVLKAPDIPSVLVEVGFLSSRSDEKRVLAREYRDMVVRSIVRGVDAYVGE